MVFFSLLSPQLFGGLLVIFIFVLKGCFISPGCRQSRLLSGGRSCRRSWEERGPRHSKKPPTRTLADDAGFLAAGRRPVHCPSSSGGPSSAPHDLAWAGGWKSTLVGLLAGGLASREGEMRGERVERERERERQAAICLPVLLASAMWAEGSLDGRSEG